MNERRNKSMTDSTIIKDHELTKYEAEELLKEMQSFFHTRKTMNLHFRKQMLRKLKSTIKKYEAEVQDALYKDLRKSEAESYITEIGLLYQSIDYFIRNLERFSRRKMVKRHTASILSQGYLYKEPYGTVLIISAFNYPFQLLMEPLIGAIAAGNNAVIKPSEQAVYTEAVIEKIIKEAFPPTMVQVVKGGKDTVTSLTTSDFDYIFFTGSVSTGRIIMGNASRNLTPVTLELGGKSPAIVMKRANIKNAARKIIYGKFLNAGQTCIAPDYVLAHEDVMEELVVEMKRYLRKFYRGDPRTSKDYSRIISKKALKRLSDILEEDKEYVVHGGDVDPIENYMAPTLLVKNDMNLRSMEEEIFGPILPIIRYQDINKTLDEIQPLGKPLAFYVFTEDRVLAEKVLKRVSFGGGCINDVLFHISSPYLTFGGVGNSGIGRYHGRYSFDTFSHEKAVLKSSSYLNMRINEPPITNLKETLIRKILK
jgi:aldehyde dehydrogenase (NAD+)